MRRRRLVVAFAALLLLGAAAVPLVAFVIVPQLVRSTLVEDLPAASVVAAAPLVAGELVRISAADYGSGTVRIVRAGDARVLRFDNVDIAGAPDVYVYLSDRSDGAPGRYVDLGKLKATNGSFNYVLPAEVDLGRVRSVVLWCRQFSVTITYAVLRAP
jgi:hypothetical protein